VKAKPAGVARYHRCRSVNVEREAEFCCWRTATRCPGDGLDCVCAPGFLPSTTCSSRPHRRAHEGRVSGRNPGLSRRDALADRNLRLLDSMSGSRCDAGHLGAAASVAESTRPISPVRSHRASFNGRLRRRLVDRMTTAGKRRIMAAAETSPRQGGEDIEDSPRTVWPRKKPKRRATSAWGTTILCACCA